jgi:hypothetical protein
MSSDQHDELARLKRPDEIDEVFGRANPNPDRIGCPSHDVLVALAGRVRPLGDPAYDHLSECSPCYLEVRALKEATDLRRRRIFTWAAAAGLLLATGSAGWFLLYSAGGAVDVAEVRTQLDLRPYALVRGEAPQGDRPPLLLPTGSEPGPYEVQIRDSSATSKVSARGGAELRNQITTLEVTVDLGSLSPGVHQLAVRRTAGDWQRFPVQVQ